MYINICSSIADMDQQPILMEYEGKHQDVFTMVEENDGLEKKYPDDCVKASEEAQWNRLQFL